MNLLRLSLSCALAAGLALSGSQLLAQDQNSNPNPSETQNQPAMQGHHKSRRHHSMNPDSALKRMTKRYNLTEDQQNQIRPILTNEQEQMKSLKENQSMSKSDRWTKMKSIHSDTVAKIEGVLNPQQKEKFEQDQQRMQERMAHHQRHEGSGNSNSNTGTNNQPPQ